MVHFDYARGMADITGKIDQLTAQMQSALAASTLADEKRTWYYTFARTHINPITGLSLGQNYVKLYGTEVETRAEMNARFGSRWSFQYPNADDIPVPEGDIRHYLYEGAGVEKHNLTELHLENVEAFCEPVITHADRIAWQCAYASSNVMVQITSNDDSITCPECKARRDEWDDEDEQD